MNYKYLKGPIFSRRLGKSLGINLIPNNVCSLNCVYCEAGLTSDLSLKREEFIPTKKVINELDHFLSSKPKLDYITFSSTGEPTLHNGIKEIIEYLKVEFPQYKIALLTNATIFINGNLIDDVKKVDLIVPSLDAVYQETFEKINRPHEEIKINDLIKALVKMKNQIDAEYWLEIFIIHGLNDSKKELNKFIETINQIKPDKIQLNSLDRPAPEKWVKPVNDSVMVEIGDYLSQGLDDNIIIDIVRQKN
jgi:wyosine [tRNA(Phe)-imidazoG37] synthetase (radical SAM superfamily)